MNYISSVVISFLVPVFQILATPLAYAAPPPPVAPLWADESPTLVGSSPSSKKWNPGHYVKSGRSFSQKNWAFIFSEPNIKGVMAQYTWRELEPTKDNYKFSRIHDDLAYLKAKGKYLCIKVEDRQFSSPDPATVLPNYIINSSAYGPAPTHGWWPKGTDDGVQARSWDPAVMDRKIALSKALAAEFDSDPNIAFVLIHGESAPSFKGNQDPTYNGRTFVNETARFAEASKNFWKQTPQAIGANWFNNSGTKETSENLMSDYIANTYDAGLGMYWPDVIVPSLKEATTAQVEHSAIPYYNKYPLFATNSISSSFKSGGTAKTLFNQIVNINKANYVFWQSTSLKADGALDEINRNDGKTNSQCPENLAGCITN